MVEWITNTMNSLGYWGIGLLMLLENLFPPIPSELIMPLAGFTVAQGKMQFIPAVAAGVLGTMIGTLPWYYLGSLGEQRLKRLVDRYGKWFALSSKDIDKANVWFNKHGAKAVFFCRLVPGLRTVISLPAGVSNLPLGLFLVYSTLGTLIWTCFLTGLGYFLGSNYYLVDDYLGPVSKVVFFVLLAGFAVWVFKRKKLRPTRRRS